MKEHLNYFIPDWLIIAGALGQIFTALVYPYIRHHVFDWYTDIKQLNPLNQEIVKTYGKYIIGLNFIFGLIGILFTQELKECTPLAVAMTGLIGIYWVGKIATQYHYYPMYEIPNKRIFKLGEVGMNLLFLLFALTYTTLFILNLIGFLQLR